MSDQMPAMIPMPDNSGGGAPPHEMSRQLSPEEERSVLLNFMGNMYGEAKKMDGNIIGEATTLKRGAGEGIKKQIEQVYAQPQQTAPPPVQSAPPQPEVQQPQVQVEQPVTPVEQQVVDESQLSFNFNSTEKDELFVLVERILDKMNHLNKKVNQLTEIVKNSKVTSLPIKRQTKKKSVDNKEEV
tara:strand:- start:3338 stop:3892 length:555 start_codon:yes stop_codon:yes gene_type:complete